MKKRFIYRMLLFILPACSAWADNAFDGGQPAAFLKLGVGAREAGMGMAQTAVCDDAYGLFFNPAGLVQLTAFQVGSQTALLASGRNLNFLSAARPVRDKDSASFATALAWTNFRYSDPLEHRVKDSPDPENTFEDSENALHLSGAGWVLPGLLAGGVTFKVLQQGLGDASAVGYSGDLGILFMARPDLAVGVALLDPVNTINWSTGANDSLPLTFRAGLAYRPARTGLLASAELEKNTAQGIKNRLGLEWWARPERLALRAGVDNGALGAGLGLRLAAGDRWWGQLDYAASTDRSEDFSFSPALMTHRLSLTLAYEISAKEEPGTSSKSEVRSEK